MKKLVTILVLCMPALTFAQKVTLNPTITPSLFQYNDQITVTYDVTGTALANLSNAWIWVWIPGKNINARYNINPATAAADPAKFTKTVTGSTTKWSITFKPSDFFTGDISNEAQMGILLKASDWPAGQTSDYIANFGFKISLVSPAKTPVAIAQGTNLAINATAPAAANFQLLVNDVLTDSKTNLLNYTLTYTVPATPADAVVKIIATAVTGGATHQVEFQYVVKQNSPVVARPAGIIAGINYNADPSKVTLCFWAPAKSTVYLLGDFSNWDVKSENLMNRDGEFFWKELTGLTPGLEYGFQYWLEGTLRIADPFADKILDPDDQYIPAASYPNLKTYPSKALSSQWYENRISVFQTNQTPYAWQVTNFVKPKKESLVVYEVLLRDFFGAGNRNYQSLIDTLSYLKRLGVNAIELMPVMEFNGNESWGYNPAFMFAPDKFYGTKNKLKELVDKCHQNGIAVIFDIAMNHQDLPNAFLMQDFNFATSKPNPTNRWFNVNATHPFNVFFDMNHESPYTKKYLDTVNYYWLNEFKIDGYRFDLTKGFTQTNNPTDVSAWSAYDASRIAILKRMADKIWQHNPTAYVIFEHLGVNLEEKEMAEYKANEGKGIMFWGKMTDQYNQNTMGYGSGSDLSGIYHGIRGWSVPHVLGYMESHDEERLMYKNLQFGNSSAGYNVKTPAVALKRMEAASTLFYTIPGPKMLWQFGELGFDYSINRCENGTINNDCRLSIKPTAWEYYNDFSRNRLFNVTANLIKLKKAANVFQNGEVTFAADNLIKAVIIRNKNFTTTPADSTQMSAVIVANFDVTTKTYNLTFPHTGTWYEYFTGSAITVAGGTHSLNLKAGEYNLFTNTPLVSPVITGLESSKAVTLQLYPNPVTDYIFTTDRLDQLELITPNGLKFRPVRVSETTWSTDGVPPGFYVAVGYKNASRYYSKLIKTH
ncbi:MAG: alpha-amylase [Cyclobacteriaceae bacterium]|nr:alpha-amylase [Cyclobacteriaceae bacterium]